MLKYIIILLVIVSFSNDTFGGNKKCYKPQIFIIRNLDSGHYTFLKYKYFKVDQKNFGFISNRMLYYVQDSFKEVDSFSLSYVKVVDGYLYDSINKAIIIWQYESGIYECYYLPSFKNFNHHILNRDIIDMDYSPILGFLFTSKGFLDDSVFLYRYPIVLKDQDPNVMHDKYEKQYKCGQCGDISIVNDEKVVVTCHDSVSSIYRMNYIFTPIPLINKQNKQQKKKRRKRNFNFGEIKK